ncbi:MAG: hypothetical protein GYB67_08160, partial [Chloroflexi bacterium]|nr:hypothetical protein [Chloroflexota bacterium]
RADAAETSALLSAAQLYVYWGDRDLALDAAHALEARGLPQATALVNRLEDDL